MLCAVHTLRVLPSKAQSAAAVLDAVLLTFEIHSSIPGRPAGSACLTDEHISLWVWTPETSRAYMHAFSLAHV